MCLFLLHNTSLGGRKKEKKEGRKIGRKVERKTDFTSLEVKPMELPDLELLPPEL
jgi:hypothetical protein